ncbi:Ion transport 2 domain protein [Solidesulfovibrio fructosivorans JJ]]|uniref:Ion transport 2 domain protein n=1 Tax=Solidesulfovibrio fructosivorans JJ] TaxID=596151 RepID=E1JV68_SOLFR|nr:potassium channel family protein [Solidesulfovibrio fructosivorans]EFL51662.1 Ion transport 2 domain protein [Solidesulfovibrio fructosivorans JJ]]
MTNPVRVWRRVIASPFATALLLVAAMLVLATAGFYFLELRHSGKSLFDALWWAMVTLTTVGYGDIVPGTVAGRLIGMAIMVAGIGVMAALSANLASVLIERKNRKSQGLLPVKTAGHSLVLGYNAQAPELLRALIASAPAGITPAVVLVATITPEAFAELSADIGQGDRLAFCRGNPASEPTLGRASPITARAAYILSQDGLTREDADQQSLLAALTVKSMAPKLRLYAEAMLESNRKHLSRAGVDVTLIPGELAGRALGAMGEHPALWHFLEHLLGHPGERPMHARNLTAEEKGLPWSQLVGRALAAGSGELPVAVFRLPRDIAIKDLLDVDAALDSFILEMLTAYGQDGRIASQGPSVLVNPGDGVELTGFDGLIALRMGGQATGHDAPAAAPAPATQAGAGGRS